MNNSRRAFLGRAGVAAAAMAMVPSIVDAAFPAPKKKKPFALSEQEVVLF